MPLTRPRAVARAPARTRGLSLVEVMVALVVFSIGALGIAGLQLRALQYGQASLFRSQASALTDDVIDRMRVDRTRARGGDWDTDFGDAADAIDPTASPARADLQDWKRQVEALLPEGQARVEIVAATRVITVTLRWNESRVPGESVQMQTRSQL